MLIERMAQDTVYDLCIIGAGIAGLNALFVARQYLPPGARVALIDRHEQAGGMWNATYDYVRLHQPHPMFTAGDIDWQLSKPKTYLATGAEVQAHLAYCLATLSRGLTIEPYWAHDATHLTETETRDGPLVEIDLTACDPARGSQRLCARRVIHAKGLDIPVSAPLKLSSDAVISTTPQALGPHALKGRDIYVIGGGKTGMDTVLHLANISGRGALHLIAGKGTLFTNRDQFFPTGLQRYFSQTSNLKTTIDIAMRFDGDNAPAVFEHFRDQYSSSPEGRGEHFLFGILSPAEGARIADATQTIQYDYLSDVIDTETGPQLQLRQGACLPLAAGSVIVNCTGLVFRSDSVEPPLLSPGGMILSINARQSFNFLSSVSAYFLTHLFYTGQIETVPFYVLDQNALMRADRKTWQVSGTAQGLLNALLMSEALPFKVFRQFGLDFDRWHPPHKRLAGLIDLQLNRKKYVRHCRQVLDDVATRHQVLCAPLRRV